MKIAEIKSFLLTAPRDLHIIKIETDEGIYGLGEALVIHYLRDRD